MTTRQSFLIGLIPAALLAAFLIGRGTAPTPQAAQEATVAPAADAAAQPPAAGVPSGVAGASGAAATAPAGGPMMSGVTPPGGDVAPDAPLSPTPDMDAQIAKAEKSGDKKAISSAYTERGTTHMYDEKAGRKVKYRAALDDFRKALAADPKNQDAKAAKDTIESIYKSLGRPIPQ